MEIEEGFIQGHSFFFTNIHDHNSEAEPRQKKN